ncbi:hypothetical protein GCM10011342_14100 [Aquisalinus flavus]|uniref:Uncharacterized protein n=1 Tax=Aquisalinus flavus TaxID=1526572 RepID=A0A8J2V510_9PROT|nr:hypothetical protein GCM10011342_14100 [Aquisalinus flavus]
MSAFRSAAFADPAKNPIAARAAPVSICRIRLPLTIFPDDHTVPDPLRQRKQALAHWRRETTTGTRLSISGENQLIPLFVVGPAGIILSWLLFLVLFVMKGTDAKPA